MIKGEPSRAPESHATHDEGWQMDKSYAVESRREKASDVLVIADEKDAGNSTLQLRDSRHCLGKAFVNVGIQRAGMVCVFDDVMAIGTVLLFLEQS